MFSSISLDESTLTGRFGFLLEGLYRAVAASIARDRTRGPLIILICRRLRRMATRFARLAEQAATDTLPLPRIGSLFPRAPRPPPPQPPPQSQRPPEPKLPGEFAWLLRLLGAGAGGATYQLRALLLEPEMIALIAAAPQVGRILRPLCRMLALPPTPPLPARPARPQAPAEPVAEPGPVAEPLAKSSTRSSAEPLAEPARDGTPPRWAGPWLQHAPPPKPI